MDDTVFLMDPETGVVQTEAEWRSTYSLLPADLWGGERFEEVPLIRVTGDDGVLWRVFSGYGLSN